MNKKQVIMTTRTKSVLIYVSGIITGIILTYAFFFVVALGNADESDIIMFDEPQQEIKAHSFRVMQVLSDGSALAEVAEYEDYSYYGTVVMFLANGDKGSTYYDNQIIEVPSGKRVMQVGTYKYGTYYATNTVPVVEFLDE